MLSSRLLRAFSAWAALVAAASGCAERLTPEQGQMIETLSFE